MTWSASRSWTISDRARRPVCHVGLALTAELGPGVWVMPACGPAAEYPSDGYLVELRSAGGPVRDHPWIICRPTKRGSGWARAPTLGMVTQRGIAADESIRIARATGMNPSTGWVFTFAGYAIVDGPVSATWSLYRSGRIPPRVHQPTEGGRGNRLQPRQRRRQVAVQLQLGFS